MEAPGLVLPVQEGETASEGEESVQVMPDGSAPPSASSPGLSIWLPEPLLEPVARTVRGERGYRPPLSGGCSRGGKGVVSP